MYHVSMSFFATVSLVLSFVMICPAFARSLNELEDLDEIGKGRIKAIDAEIRRHPGQWKLYEKKAKLYRNMFQEEKALTEFEKAIRLNPKEPRLYRQKAELYMSLGRNAEALREYHRLLVQDPGDAGALTGIAVILQAGGQGPGDNDEALKFFNRSIQADPGSKSSHEYRGELYMKLGRYREAAKDFDFLVKNKPGDMKSLFLRADAYLKGRDYPRALADYTRIIELHGDVAEPYVIRGDVYRSAGSYRKARSDYEKAIKLEPPREVMARAHYGLAMVYHKLGESKLEKEELSRARALGYFRGERSR
ncbi:MAG: tetratricopeptide repeat protein [Candidatus Obscuribacterales bacterium]